MNLITQGLSPTPQKMITQGFAPVGSLPPIRATYGPWTANAVIISKDDL